MHRLMEQIMDICEIRKISKKELCRRTGVSKGALNGKHTPRLSTIQLLAHTLGYEVFVMDNIGHVNIVTYDDNPFALMAYLADKLKGWSKWKLCLHAGKTRNFIDNGLNNYLSCSIDSFEDMAEALGLKVELMDTQFFKNATKIIKIVIDIDENDYYKILKSGENFDKDVAFCAVKAIQNGKKLEGK